MTTKRKYSSPIDILLNKHADKNLIFFVSIYYLQTKMSQKFFS